MRKKRLLITVMLILIIVGPILYFMYEKFIDTDDKDNGGAILRDVEISKINKDKDYIYEADYESEFKEESYTTDIGQTYYSKDLKVPYINIDSLDAINANRVIKETFTKAVEAFNQGIEDKTTFVDLSYDNYENDKIISVIVKYDVRDSEISNPTYYTYNFDSKTGELITYEDALKIADFETDTIDKKVKEAIGSEIKNQMGDNPNVYPKGTSFETYLNNTYKAYKENNDIKFILDNDNNLSIVVDINVPAQLDHINRLLEIK